MTKRFPGRDSTELDKMFHAIADGTRRAIVERLVHSPASVSTIAEPFDAALPTIVEHLRVLERASIVSSEKVGRVRTYQLMPDALVPADRWIVAQRGANERRLDRLGDHLAESLADAATTSLSIAATSITPPPATSPVTDPGASR